MEDRRRRQSAKGAEHHATTEKQKVLKTKRDAIYAALRAQGFETESQNTRCQVYRLAKNMTVEDAVSRIQQLHVDKRGREQEEGDVEVAFRDVQHNQQRRRIGEAIVTEDFELASEEEYTSALLQWPQPITRDLCEARCEWYEKKIMSDEHKPSVCSVCGFRTDKTNLKVWDIGDFVKKFTSFCKIAEDSNRFWCLRSLWTMYPELNNLVLEKSGLQCDDYGNLLGVNVCRTCESTFRHNIVSRPMRFLSNGNYFGELPDCLRDLTLGEKLALGFGRSMLYHVRLYPVFTTAPSTAQRFYCGHSICFAQNPTSILTTTTLPLHPAQIADSLLVAFVGPNVDRPKITSKFLEVRRARLRTALLWLKKYNIIYKDIQIENSAIDEYPEDLSTFVHVFQNEHTENEHQGYFPRHDQTGLHGNDGTDPHLVGVEFNGAASFDRDASSVAEQSIQATMCSRPQNVILPESSPSALMLRICPLLFPYGVGSVDEPRDSRIQHHWWVERCMHEADGRFETDDKFMFVLHNIQQRKEHSSRARFMMSQKCFDNISARLQDMEQVHLAIKLAAAIQAKESAVEQTLIQKGADVGVARDLLREMRLISMGAPGSFFSRRANGEEMRAAGVFLGMPFLFVTINFPDTHSPLVQLRAGTIDDISARVAQDTPPPLKRAQIVSQRPVAVAEAFNRMMEAVLLCLFGWSVKHQRSVRGGGILGYISWYYFILETQMRGSLHAHGLVRLHGVPPLPQLQEKLQNAAWSRRFCDFVDTIVQSNVPLVEKNDSQYEAFKIPKDVSQTIEALDLQFCPVKQHPAAKRGFVKQDLKNDDINWDTLTDADLFEVLYKASIHVHSHTCWKKGLNRCRFHFPRKRWSVTHFSAAGDLHIARNHPWLNAYNKWIALKTRANHDIRVIGTGPSAYKSIKYCELYASKSPDEMLKVWKTLDEALSKPRLQEQLAQYRDDQIDHARAVILKLLNAVTGKVHVSAVLAATKLLRLPDHYASHFFVPLYFNQFRKVACKSPDPKVSDLEEPQEELQEDQEEQIADGGDEELVEAEDEDGDEGIVQVLARSNVRLNCNKTSNQCATYCFRSALLENMCVYEFFSWYKKDKGSLKAKENIKGALRLLKDHAQQSTYHIQRYEFQHIPVLRGCPLPQEPTLDSPMDKKTKYAQCMLVLFKPWREQSDLLGVHDSWWDAFNEWYRSLPEDAHVLQWMSNMQSYFRADTDVDIGAIGDSEYDPNVPDEDAHKIARNSSDKDDSLIRDDDDDDNDDVESAQLTQEKKHQVLLTTLHSTGLLKPPIAYVLNVDQLENTTIFQSEQRLRENWDRITSTLPPLVVQHPTNPMEQPRIVQERILPPINMVEQEFHEDLVLNVCQDFRLNRLQELAFRKVVQHLNTNEQLGMFITGPAGTGKSQILKAVSRLMFLVGQQNAVSVVSFMGCASSLVSGLTIHKAFGFGLDMEAQITDESKQKLQLKWSGIRLLMIDEVSTLSCSYFHAMDRRLKELFCNELPFGGLHVLCFGDFHQCSPVVGAPLWMDAKTKRGQIEAGRTQWKHFNKVRLVAA